MVAVAAVQKLYEAQYVPNEPPTDPAQIGRYLKDELERVAAAIKLLKLNYMTPTLEEPSRPAMGLPVYALGAPYWDPGSGEGWYYYTSLGNWTQLG